ncbi:MAG TPA: DUF2171 domain-containing protein [Gaiellaceae bacterium]|nr:DUF2171 domain-containing protein [Gaiellaceae bacterium]
MADPVSWFVVERGWAVVGSDGAKLGTVDEVLGDSSLDIFDGLAVASGVLGKPRYVPAELVAEIVEGSVRLSIAGDEFGRLDEYEAPGTRRA